MTVSIFFIILLSPLSPASHVLNKNQQVLWYPTQSRTTQEIDSLQQMVDYVPYNASVITMNHIFPHISGRLNAYVLPVLQANDAIERDLQGYINGLIEGADYVLLDLNVLDFWSEYAFERIVSSSEFGVWKTQGNSVLFKRGLSDIILPGDQVQHFTVSEINFGSHELVTNLETNELVAKSNNGSKPGLFVYGPYTFLPEGNYRVSYKVKIENPQASLLGYYQITHELEEVVTRKNIWSYDYSDDERRDVEIIIGLDRVSMLTEFQLYSYGVADIYLSEITISPLDIENVLSSTKSFYHENLATKSAEVTSDMTIRSGNTTSNELWYGPYAQVNPGQYEVEFNLRAQSISVPYSNHVITLDVISSKTLSLLAEYNVTSVDVDHGDWIKIVLQFSIQEPQKLEFRGMHPSEVWIIELSDIALNPIIPETVVQSD